MSLAEKQKQALRNKYQVPPRWKDGKILTNREIQLFYSQKFYPSKAALRRAEGKVPDSQIKEAVDGFYVSPPSPDNGWADLTYEEQLQAINDDYRKERDIPLDKDLPSDPEQRALIVGRAVKQYEEGEEYIWEATLEAWESRLDEFLELETDCRAKANITADNSERRQLLREADIMRNDAIECCTNACDLCKTESEADDLRHRLELEQAESKGIEPKTGFEQELLSRAPSWRNAFEYNLLCIYFKQEGIKPHYAKEARDVLTLDEKKSKQYRNMLIDSTKKTGWKAFRKFFHRYEDSPEAKAIIQKYTRT